MLEEHEREEEKSLKNWEFQSRKTTGKKKERKKEE